jgi:AbrB family looped-hinge helix DNA binding protein
MAIAQSKVTAQGQISVPAEIRRRLGIGPGSILEWDQEGEAVVVRRLGRFSSEDIHAALFGSMASPRRSPREMDEGIARHLKEKHARR